VLSKFDFYGLVVVCIAMHFDWLQTTVGLYIPLIHHHMVCNLVLSCDRLSAIIHFSCCSGFEFLSQFSLLI